MKLIEFLLSLFFICELYLTEFKARFNRWFDTLFLKSSGDGGSISQFLSVRRKEIKTPDLIDRYFIPHLLTDEDIKLLFEQNKKTPFRWIRITKMFKKMLRFESKSFKHIVTVTERKIFFIINKKYPEKNPKYPIGIRNFIGWNGHFKFIWIWLSVWWWAILFIAEKESLKLVLLIAILFFPLPHQNCSGKFRRVLI